MDLWYSVVSLIAVSEGNLPLLEEVIDNHIQAMLRNSLVSLIVEISTIDLQ